MGEISDRKMAGKQPLLTNIFCGENRESGERRGRRDTAEWEGSKTRVVSAPHKLLRTKQQCSKTLSIVNLEAIGGESRKGKK